MVFLNHCDAVETTRGAGLFHERADQSTTSPHLPPKSKPFLLRLGPSRGFHGPSHTLVTHGCHFFPHISKILTTLLAQNADLLAAPLFSPCITSHSHKTIHPGPIQPHPSNLPQSHSPPPPSSSVRAVSIRPSASDRVPKDWEALPWATEIVGPRSTTSTLGHEVNCSVAPRWNGTANGSEAKRNGGRGSLVDEGRTRKRNALVLVRIPRVLGLLAVEMRWISSRK